MYFTYLQKLLPGATRDANGEEAMMLQKLLRLHVSPTASEHEFVFLLPPSNICIRKCPLSSPILGTAFEGQHVQAV